MTDIQTNSCSFCGNAFPGRACPNCSKLIYPIFDTLLKKQTNQQKNPLANIDNLVFQGGGIKGICYLGALEQLGDEFISKVKKFAGTSAGSMCSLYLGLGKTQKELHDLMYSANFVDKLDKGIDITMKWADQNLVLSAKEIFFAMNKYFANNSLPTDPEDASDVIAKIIFNIVFYLSYKLEFSWYLEAARIGMAFQYGSIKEFIISLVEKLFFPKLQDTDQPDQVSEKQDKFIRDTIDVAAKKVEKAKDSGSEPYIYPRVKPGPPADNLKDEVILNYAIVEFFYTCYMYQEKELFAGLFDGVQIKKEMIIDPIAKSLEAIGLGNLDADKITFKELSELKNQQGELAFRSIYVTAVNTSTLRTEVFSVDHTPNAVVSDAVRASMSIPLFFKAVTIREKLPGQTEPTPRLAYANPLEGKAIVYVDGGVLDNYPLWIFDDLKYMIGNDVPAFQPERKLGVMNPKTLGFRLVPAEKIDNYTKPYYDEEQRKVKASTSPNPFKGYGDMMKFVYASLVSFGPQENEFVQLGEIPRTVYIDTLGVKTTDFDQDDAHKDTMVESGRQGVKDYIKRAENSFKGEIGEYPKIK